MKIKRRAAAALKALMCAAVLFIALFPIYWPWQCVRRKR